MYKRTYLATVLACGIVGIYSSIEPVSGDEPGNCCYAGITCSGSELCCSPESLNAQPCSVTIANYCVNTTACGKALD